MGSPIRIPTHRRHASGLGVVTFAREDHYTGRWGSPESEAEYRRLVAEYVATGRPPEKKGKGAAELTFGDLVGRYSAFVLSRYRRRGEASGHGLKIARILGEVAEVHGATPASQFGPKTLRIVRDGWSRGDGSGPARMNRPSANQAAGYVVRMYQWAVGREMVDEAAWRKLTAVEPLSRLDGCREMNPRGSVPTAVVEATLPHLPPVAAAIVRLMLACGCRPSEACAIRPCDLEYGDDIWIYRVHPDWNKGEWRGRKKTVYLGPRAQAALCGPGASWRAADWYCFRPRRTARRSGNVPYLAATLHAVIEIACEKNGIPHWSPYNLRHAALTEIHRVLGIDAARVTGGHSSIRTTLGYIDEDVATAEDRAKAREVALALG